MADLTSNFVGIKSPNPFWLASAPPTDKEYNVRRAFEAGWGGVVWKTLGSEGPPVVNVNGPRYGVVHGADRRVLGLNNIELITDRDLYKNLDEIKRVKIDYPDRAIIVSLMVPCEEEAWKAILPLVEETGADGIELNFGCPHGMAERGMGAAVGQVPEYIEMVTRWCKQYYSKPVIVKLTPNITDVRQPAAAAQAGGADAVSLINTINSIISVDLDVMAPNPTIDGKGTHGGYCGPAVKPIAMNMVAEIARDPETSGLPISGIGGITNWRDAAEYMVLGCGNVQVCTAAMTYGFKIVEEMISGLSQWMDEKGHTSIDDFVGKSSFHRVLWDDAEKGRSSTKLKTDDDIKRVVMCSGKIYYDLLAERDERGIDNIYLLRIEQLYPVANAALQKEMKRFKNADVVWCQEEPKNQGAWSFINPHIERNLNELGAKHTRPQYIGREAAAAPATGLASTHKKEQIALVDQALTLKG